MPRIGLISDTHSRALATRQAVALLCARGAEMLLHLGDVGAPEVLDELMTPMPGDGRRLLPVHVVFGNTDYDIAGLGRYAAELGLHVAHPVGSLELPDGMLVFTHGDNAQALTEAVARGARYFCHGHTHHAADGRLGATRVINPGALCRARPLSVALLDTQADAVEFVNLPE